MILRLVMDLLIKMKVFIVMIYKKINIIKHLDLLEKFCNSMIQTNNSLVLVLEPLWDLKTFNQYQALEPATVLLLMEICLIRNVME